MIRIKIEQNKKNEPVFKLSLKDDELDKYKFLKRALIESKTLKGKYNYNVPIRFFEPIFKNLKNEDFKISKNSLKNYLEFSDEYDENYYYKLEADSKYMKKWRDEGCPDIYKIIINIEDKTLCKEIAFKKVSSINI